MAEVQQLINEMSQLVQEQGETIDNIEQTTAVVAVDVEKGYAFHFYDPAYRLTHLVALERLREPDIGPKKRERKELCAFGSSS